MEVGKEGGRGEGIKRGRREGGDTDLLGVMVIFWGRGFG
jgi:hypothetical protein